MIPVKKKKKKVSFDAVEIREYPIVLSDNPASKYGPSLELGWDYRLATVVQPIGQKKERPIGEGPLRVDDYEDMRPSSKRRTLKNLYLHLPTREFRIKKHNFTDEEIAKAAAIKAKIHASRERSNFCQNPVTTLYKGLVIAGRRTKKVQRAVRNLKKQKAAETDDIYKGWWLPLSAHLF